MSCEGLILILCSAPAESQDITQGRGFRYTTKVGDLIEIGSFSNAEHNEQANSVADEPRSGSRRDQFPIGLVQNFADVLYPKRISVYTFGTFKEIVEEMAAKDDGDKYLIVREFKRVCERLSGRDRSSIIVIARDSDKVALR